MPSSPKYGTSIQNLKTVADKIMWRVQYQDRVVGKRFEVRVVLTPPGGDSVELAWCASADTKKDGRYAAAAIGLAYFDQQPLTLVLGGRYERNETRMCE
jgi:hypothetical protein